MQSFITGQLMIQLDFYPGHAGHASRRASTKNYIEIPTIPSTSAELAEALEKLDLKGMEKHLESTLAGIDRFVNNPDLTASIRGLNETLQDARKLAHQNRSSGGSAGERREKNRQRIRQAGQ